MSGVFTYETKPYARKVLDKLNVNGFEDLSDLFLESCEKFSDKEAFESFGQSLTFGQLEQRSRYFASYLLHHPEVVECAAVGVPDPRSGEAVSLHVVSAQRV